MLVTLRGRPPTDAERREYQRAFPLLTQFSITGEADATYDCVSFTVMPKAPKAIRPSAVLVEMGGFEALDRFYSDRNFSRADHVPSDPEASCVALFALDTRPTHVALRDRQTGWWESKLGTGIRILHPLPDLEGGRYGAVIGYYSATDGR